MLLFDDVKKLEKALGEEAAEAIAHVFEKADEKMRQELATRADVREGLLRMEQKMDKRFNETDNRIAETKHDILRWMVGGFVTQTALLVAVLAFLR